MGGGERDWGEQVAEAWRGSAPYWEKHGETVRRMLAPITGALLAAARLSDGHRVLDVAGGPGEPALAVARVVGGGGLVVHTDLAPVMVAAARRAARREGLANLAFAEASGQALPFARGAFDRVVCRLGVMFFPDAPGALAEMVRVARPGGRVALAVWGARERNPYLAVPADAVAARLPSPPDPPGAPDAWRFAEAGLLAEMLAGAGASGVEERRVDFAIEAPIGFDEFWRVRVELSDTLRDKTARLGEELADRVKEDVRRATLPFFPEGRMRFPAEAVVVSGAVDRPRKRGDVREQNRER